MVSIIIPTLNEEQYLPLLLESIKRQVFGDLEIIVADAGSTDQTVSIAKEYSCLVVPGGLPAKARNHGATFAKGEWLLFLDADVVLPPGFLQTSLDELGKRKLTVASFRIKPHPDNAFEYFLLNIAYNWMIVALGSLLPHGAMAIFIQKPLFERLKGYDATITLAEDHDLVRRAAKSGKFGIIRSVVVPVSMRRFHKDGWIGTALKFFLCQLHMVFIGPVRSNMFNYGFGGYKKNKK